jgi:hypothetical protein
MLPGFTPAYGCHGDHVAAKDAGVVCGTLTCAAARGMNLVTTGALAPTFTWQASPRRLRATAASASRSSDI